MDAGLLVYEYNLMMLERYTGQSEQVIPSGKHEIRVDTTIGKPGAAGDVVATVDGTAVFQVALPQTVPLAFTASETLDVGIDLGSPVSAAYVDRAPFGFDGQIDQIEVSQ